MSEDPVKAAEDAPLGKIVSLMVRNRVGSIVIVDSDNVPAGMITERELLREISLTARLNAQAEAKDLMVLSFIKIPPDTPVPEAARAMIKRRVRIIVTKKNGKLDGIVSTTDFLRYFSKTAKDVPIEDAIHRKVTTIEGSRGALDAIRLMHEKRIGSVVITRSGLPFGIVTERDLLRILAKGRRKEFGSLRLEELANRPLITAQFGISAREAASIMLANKIKRLPILRGDELIGIITAKDLVGAYSAASSVRPREVIPRYVSQRISRRRATASVKR